MHDQGAVIMLKLSSFNECYLSLIIVSKTGTSLFEINKIFNNLDLECIVIA